ncbi:MAG: DUF3795 domain-containing protein [bacterium]
MKQNEPNKILAAVCGLFCPSCTVYIASNEEPARLERQAKAMNKTIEETRCEGCRSEKRNSYCANCHMFKCAKEKGIDFCANCDMYPCTELKEFQSKFPHRLELWKDSEKIKAEGYEKWFVESYENYTCEFCGTINSGWDIKCRNCGSVPSCNYINNNITEIKKRMNLV